MKQELATVLDRSRPELPESVSMVALSEALVGDVVASQRSRRSRRVVATIGASLIGALTLTTGGAFAAPILTEWWLWAPAEDAVLTTDPFLHEGEWKTCDIMFSVMTDGQTAVEDSAARLLDARAFLSTVNVDDYTLRAQEILEQELGGFPEETRSLGFATQRAISEDFFERGLLGAGVSLESSVKCTAP